MIKQLKDSGRLKITFLLFVMTLFCFSLSIFRFYVSETKVFLFLNWNLFLAFIPWLISTFIALHNDRKNKFALSFLLIAWLLFFPNSPYILTDLFHLKLRSAIPIWFDLVVILSFAWTGLAYGFISLLEIETLLREHLKPKIVQLTIILMLFLGSFGVYIGRYLRWNSWDVVNDPSSLFADIGDRFMNPFSHPRTWGLTILMGILLNMIYLTLKLFQPKKI